MRKAIYFCVAGILSMLAIFAFLLHPRGRRRLYERFGFWHVPPGRYVWLHGASVGELRGVLALEEWIREHHNHPKILLTSFSITGIETFQDRADVCRLLPFDWLPCVLFALRGIAIERFYFGETEVWPTLFGVLRKRNTEMILVNGRMEERSFVWYQRLRLWFGPALQSLTKLCVASKEASERFTKLGVSVERIRVTGNSKYDREPLYRSDIERRSRRDSLFQSHRIVVTLGSIHPEEELIWLNALLPLRNSFLFVLCPRHLEKLDRFVSSLDSLGFVSEWYSCIKSQALPVKDETEVLLCDTFGELEMFYSVSDLGFVGGTLVPIGGHNPLEPALYGIPICVGPYIEKIQYEVEYLQKSCAITMLCSPDDARKLLERLLAKDEELISQGVRAKRVCEELRGALKREIAFLEGR